MCGGGLPHIKAIRVKPGLNIAKEMHRPQRAAFCWTLIAKGCLVVPVSVLIGI